MRREQKRNLLLASVCLLYTSDVGVRIEDLVLVTETGCEILNSYGKDLEII